MLKINLLPPHINTRKQVRVAIVMVTLLVAAEAAFLVWMRQAPAAEFARLSERETATNTGFTELQGLQTKAQELVAAEGALKPKYLFLTDMLKYNRAYPNLYERTARYIYRDVTLSSLRATPNSLSFDAYASNPSAVSLLMIGLSNDPDLTFPPTISGVPAYNEEAERARKLQAQQAARQMMGAELPNMSIIGAPGFGGADTGLAGGGGAGGNGPGAMGPGAMAMGGPAAFGGGNGPGPMGAPMGMGGRAAFDSAGGGNGPGGGAMGMASGGAMGGGGGGDVTGVLRLGGARKPPLGFMVSVAAGLQQPISRPTYGTADSQAGSGGGGGASFGGGGFGGGNGPMGGSMGPGPGGMAPGGMNGP